MTRKTKKILFYGAVVLFLASSFFVILYAQGFKYSLKDGKFYLTGAISIKANADGKIYLNDELEGSTSFFGATFGIDRLLPGNYKIAVVRDNYSVWKKVVAVQEGLVADFPNVLILPVSGEEKEAIIAQIEQDLLQAAATPSPTPTPTKTSTPKPGTTPPPSPSPSPIEDLFILKNKRLYRNDNQELKEIVSGVNGFALSRSGKKIAWWTNYEVWVMWLEDTSYQPFIKKDQRELISRFSRPIQSGIWFNKGEDHIVLKMAGTTSTYRIVEIDKRGGLNIIEY